MNLQIYLLTLAAMLIFATGAWIYSVWRHNVGVVDSLWSLFFLLASVIFASSASDLSNRGLLLIALVAIWSLRLSIYIAWRNHGRPEDYRYQTIRANNEPRFWLKSWYIVFGLQATLAWIISMPLLPAITSSSPLIWIDVIALLLFLTGLLFEAGGDFQLARFRSDSRNKGRVLDTGFWRYTRHPNYFGDFCVWWAFYLFAAAAGAWWSVVAPVLMSLLLLRVSGVSLLEKTIGERRPEYAQYIERTNAFFPGPMRRVQSQLGAER